jgi:hypothetical protein
MSQAQTPTQKFVETALRNTGLLQIIPAIISDIEEEIAGSYDAIDEDEDGGSAPSYGGVIYYTHNLIDEGNWDYQLEKRTSDSQKRLLLKLVEDNNLSLSVERTDWRQKWQFILTPEIAPNTNERIEIEVEIDISVLTPTSFSITATSDDEDVNYDEMLFLLTLSS